jgi:hypothetical protein
MKNNRLRKVASLKAATATKEIWPIYQLLSEPGIWYYINGLPYDGKPLPPFTPQMTLISHLDASGLCEIYGHEYKVFEKIRANYGIENDSLL